MLSPEPGGPECGCSFWNGTLARGGVVDHLGTVRKPGDPVPRARIAAVSSWDPLRLPIVLGAGESMSWAQCVHLKISFLGNRIRASWAGHSLRWRCIARASLSDGAAIRFPLKKFPINGFDGAPDKGSWSRGQWRGVNCLR